MHQFSQLSKVKCCYHYPQSTDKETKSDMVKEIFLKINLVATKPRSGLRKYERHRVLLMEA